LLDVCVNSIYIFGLTPFPYVKKLLQEYQLETWLRDRVPLIYASDELVAVGNLWVSKDDELKATDEKVVVQWHSLIGEL
jgi:hypothetical protein